MSLKVATGTYVGNGGTSGTRVITGIGFQPKVVFVWSAFVGPMFTFQSAINGLSSNIGYLGENGWWGTSSATSDRFRSFDADGFTIAKGSSTPAVLNENSTTFHYLALGGEYVVTNSYTGNATDNRNITGLGFRPEMLMIMGGSQHQAVKFFSSGTVADSAAYLNNAANVANMIQRLDEDGFQIGTAAQVNTSAQVYYYMAIRSSHNVYQRRYTGNATDNRAITGLGFSPDFVLIKSTAARNFAVRSSTHTGDTAKFYRSSGFAANYIQGFLTDGFEIGTAADINTSSDLLDYIAFKNNQADFEVNVVDEISIGEALSPVGLNGWLRGFSWRKQITITGETGAGKNYNVFLKFGNSSGGSFNLGGKSVSFPTAKGTGGDIRFTLSDGDTPIPFWVEEVVGGVASVWLRVPEDLSTTKTIFIYYGNSAAPNASSAENTFLFFDDFEGSSVDTNKWVVENGSPTVSSSEVNMGINGLMRMKDVLVSGPFSYGFRLRRTGSVDAGITAIVNDAVHPQNIQFGNTSYHNHGVYTYGSGPFNLSQTGHGDNTTGNWIYRLKVYGTTLRWDQTNLAGGTRTMPLSANSYQFKLVMFSGCCGPYYPGNPVDFCYLRPQTASGIEPEFSAAGSAEAPIYSVEVFDSVTVTDEFIAGEVLLPSVFDLEVADTISIDAANVTAGRGQTLYWVGGSGEWDSDSGIKWSYTSGGAGGVDRPTQHDDVRFDANSGSGTVIFATNLQMASLDFTGFTGKIESWGYTYSIYGSLTMVPDLLIDETDWWDFRFLASTGTHTIDLANNRFYADFKIGGDQIPVHTFTSTWNLVSDVIKEPTSAYIGWYVRYGNFNSNGHTFDVDTFAAYSAAYSTEQTINLTGSEITGDYIDFDHDYYVIGWTTPKVIATDVVVNLTNNYSSFSSFYLGRVTMGTLNILGGVFSASARTAQLHQIGTIGTINVNKQAATALTVESRTYKPGLTTVTQAINSTESGVTFQSNTVGWSFDFELLGNSNIQNATFLRVNASFGNSIYVQNGTDSGTNTNVVFTTTSGEDITITENVSITEFVSTFFELPAGDTAAVEVFDQISITENTSFLLQRTLFWVGGTESWNATAGTKWATSSGGTGGESVPTQHDHVRFDNNSSGTITVASLVNCDDLNFTGFTGTFAGSAGINIYGSLTLPAGGSVTYNGNWNFLATTTGKTITTAGKNLPAKSTSIGGFIFNGVGGEWTLQDTFYSSSTTFDFRINQGTLITNNFNIDAWYVFNKGPSGSLQLGSSTIHSYNYSFTSGSGAFDAGTSTISGINTMASFFADSGLVFNNLTFQPPIGTTTSFGPQGATFNNVTITTTQAGTVNVVAVTSTSTINGTLTFTGHALINRLFVISNVLGTPRTFIAENTSITNTDFRDITASGNAAWSGTSVGNALGNTGITFTAPVTRYGVASGSWFSTATWSSTSGGCGGASVPICHDTVILNASSGSGTYTQNMPRPGADIDCTGFTGTLTTSNTAEVYGSLTLSSGMTLTASTQTYTFMGRGSHTITSAGKTWAKNMVISSVGGTYTLQDNLSTSASVEVVRGTFDANDFNVTGSNILSNYSASFVRTVRMGSGTWTATGTGNIWLIQVSGVVDAETSTIVFNDASASTKSFLGGGNTYHTLRFVGAGTGSYVVNGSNTFNTLESTKTNAFTLTFTAGNTQTITNWAVSGVASNLVSIRSSSTALHTLVKAGGGLVEADYLDIQNSNATPDATWYAGANSVNNQSVATAGSGWFFHTVTQNLNFIEQININDQQLTEAPYTETLGWYDGAWEYRVRLVVRGGQSGTLTDYPVFVDWSKLPYAFQAVATENDVRITTDDGVTEVPVEIILNGGQGSIFFKAPSLVASAHNTFYIYFGNSLATKPARDATYGSENVWTNGFKAVYHMTEDASGNGTDAVKDSTANEFHLTPSGAPVSNVAGVLPLGGITFDGSDDILRDTDQVWNAADTETTVSFWGLVATADASRTSQRVYGYTDSGSEQHSAHAPWGGISYFDFGTCCSDSRITTTFTGDEDLYRLFHLVSSGSSGTKTIYKDGVSAASSGGADNPNVNLTGLGIGGGGDGAEFHKGWLQEFRIATVARSADWAKTDHNNMSNFEAFAYAGEVSEMQAFIVSLVEDFAITEFTNLERGVDQSTFDAITLTEFTSNNVDNFADINSSVTVTEGVFNMAEAILNVFDLIAISEDVFGTTDLLPIENITITESVVAQLGDLLVNQVDVVTITENTQVTLLHQVQLTDQIFITESFETFLAYAASLIDVVTVTDVATIEPLLFTVVIDDSIVTSESVQRFVVFDVAAADDIIIEEAINTAIVLISEVFDSITISEATDVYAFITSKQLPENRARGISKKIHMNRGGSI